MKRFFWRLRATLILRNEYDWPLRASWRYSEALHVYTTEIGGEDFSPRAAIEEDRQYWE